MNYQKKTTELIYNQKISAAFKGLQKHWKISIDRLTDLEEQTITMHDKLVIMYGEPFEILKIKEERIRDFSIRETYLIRHEKYALIYILIFQGRRKLEFSFI